LEAADAPRLEFAPITDARAVLGESPVWDAEGGCIWWVDIDGRRLFRTHTDTAITEAWPMPAPVGFVVLTESGLPAVGLAAAISLFSPGDGSLKPILELEETGVRFNDATIDPAGRLWAGTMDLELKSPRGAVFSVGADHVPVRQIEGLIVQNGLAADGARGVLYVSDSHWDVQKIWRCPFDLATGKLGERQPFVDMNEKPGRPDGAALDRDGNYWIASIEGRVLHVFNPDGVLVASHPTPFSAPTKAAFGGPGLDEVYLTSKGGDAPDGELARGRFGEGKNKPVGMPVQKWKI
jgi:sugar lactone lactonase YvrE